MIKNLSLTFMSLAMLFTINSAFALDELPLPFGIVLGKTTNKEIEDKGICVQKIKVSDSYFRCEKYVMTAGNFEVYSSQNEIVQKIVFNSESRTPKAWRELNLTIGQVFLADLRISSLNIDIKNFKLLPISHTVIYHEDSIVRANDLDYFETDSLHVEILTLNESNFQASDKFPATATIKSITITEAF